LTHGFKGPLRAISNYANFLLEDTAGIIEGNSLKYLEGLHSAIEKINQQLEDLEILYSIKNHSQNSEPFATQDLLDDLKCMFEKNADHRMLVNENWPQIRGKKILLRQILVHLRRGR
jgi:signal transduction histidine kinase